MREARIDVDVPDRVGSQCRTRWIRLRLGEIRERIDVVRQPSGCETLRELILRPASHACRLPGRLVDAPGIARYGSYYGQQCREVPVVCLAHAQVSDLRLAPSSLGGNG